MCNRQGLQPAPPAVVAGLQRQDRSSRRAADVAGPGVYPTASPESPVRESPYPTIRPLFATGRNFFHRAKKISVDSGLAGALNAPSKSENIVVTKNAITETNRPPPWEHPRNGRDGDRGPPDG